MLFEENNEGEELNVGIRDRISALVEHLKMDRSAFAQSIGVKQSTFSHILNGRNNPTLNVVLQIHKSYPDISIEWLLYGQGEMSEKPLDGTANRPTTESVKQAPDMAKVVERIKYVEKPQRKIVEIRVFYDDQTFDVFTQ